MKKNSFRRIAVVITAIMMVISLATGCSDQSSEGDKETVTVYMWSSVLYNSYAPYIQEQLPDVDVQFIVGNNDLNYYKFLKENGELPDIITCRRFALIDAVPLSDQLMDLSSTEGAGAVYDTYIENFTNTDGTVNWIPLCGEADGLVANKKLFDEHGIPLPTDYDSFVSACSEFEKHGIRGFVADFAYDYTCMEVLQGLSISEINSLEGRKWRSAYEDPDNMQVTGLDDKIWPGAFAKMEQFIDDVNLKPEDTGLDYDMVMNDFKAGKIAIMRSAGSKVVELNEEGIEAVFLPYFCSDDEQWLLTYPAFQVAVNKDTGESESKKAAVLKVLDTMISDGAQNTLAGGEDVVTYSRNVNLKMSPSLDNLKPLIEQNRMFIRIASNDFFSGSLDVVQKMIKGELDADGAYREFNRQLEDKSEPETEALLSQDKTYSNIFKDEGGRESSSAMAGAVKELYGSDVIVAPACSFTETVIKAEYNENMVGGMIMPNPLEAFSCKMTGAQLKEYLKYSVEGVEGGFTPFNKGSLPAVSGISIEVEQSNKGFVLSKVLKDGKELDDSEKLNVTCLNIAEYMDPLIEKTGFDFNKHEGRVIEHWVEYIKKGGKVAEPEDYIFLNL